MPAVTWGKNAERKIRKHIDQIRRRHPKREDIPPAGKNGIARVKEIIMRRVEKEIREESPLQVKKLSPTRMAL